MQLDNKDITTILSYSQSIKHKVHEMFKEHEVRYGLTFAQLIVILSIGNEEVNNVGDIASRFMFQPTNTSALCKKMADEGLIIRKKDKNDIRVVNVYLTVKGTELYNDIVSTIESKMNGITNRQINTQKIITGLKEIEKLIILLGDNNE